MRNEPDYSPPNAEYQRQHWLLLAEGYQRQADLAAAYGEASTEKTYRDSVSKAKTEAERYRLALIGGK
jgi:hypothetical protein